MKAEDVPAEAVTVRYVEAQPDSGPHKPAMPAHYVVERGHERLFTLPAEIVDAAANVGVSAWAEAMTGPYVPHVWRHVAGRVLAAVWPLIARRVIEHDGDGYHTHAELYRYRMLYNAHAAKGWAAMGKAVKSWRHSNGEECFGGGWFVVVADLHPHGQVSNHYPAEDWDMFDVPEVDRAPEWDGHTPAQAADRLAAALAPAWLARHARRPLDPTPPGPPVAAGEPEALFDLTERKDR